MHNKLLRQLTVIKIFKNDLVFLAHLRFSKRSDC